MDERNDKRDLSELNCKICFKKAKSWKGNSLVTDMERHMMVNPTPSGSILNLFHLGAPIYCQHTYSFRVRQFFANIRFILYFLILALIVKVFGT